MRGPGEIDESHERGRGKLQLAPAGARAGLGWIDPGRGHGLAAVFADDLALGPRDCEEARVKRGCAPISGVIQCDQ
jgi:hypothetical protein